MEILEQTSHHREVKGVAVERVVLDAPFNEWWPNNRASNYQQRAAACHVAPRHRPVRRRRSRVGPRREWIAELDESPWFELV